MKSVTLHLKRENVEEMVHPGVVLPNRLSTIKNEGILAKTGAKLYYRNGGWWILSGYAWDNSDVDELIIGLL